MIYLTNTFSPAMVSGENIFTGKEINIDDAIKTLSVYGDWDVHSQTCRGINSRRQQSAVSHEVTAAVLTGLLSIPVPFNRVNLDLKDGDVVIAVCPNFRASEAREFTRQEVEEAGVRCFRIEIIDPSRRFWVVGTANDVGGSPCNCGHFPSLEEAEKVAAECCWPEFIDATVVDRMA
jgi:hypothetical protein